MNWEKFKTFAATHLELAPCLNEHLLGPVVGQKDLQRVVERELTYVAVRPWKSLDQRATGGYRLTSDSETSVSYTIYAHVAGEDRHACSRARTSYAAEDGNVGQLIAELGDWHGEYWATQADRPLVFDAVLRTCRMIGMADPFKCEHRKTLSFYLFPSDFTV